MIKQFIKTLILLIIVLGFINCTQLKYHQLDCKYISLVVAHVAEFEWMKHVKIAIDNDNPPHAQAFYIENGKTIWLTIRNGFMIITNREVKKIVTIYELKDWDWMLRIDNEN